MQFPDTQATRSTEAIMRAIKPELKEGTWHYNRAFSAVYKELEKVLPAEKPNDITFDRNVKVLDISKMPPKEAEAYVKKLTEKKQ